MKTFELYDILKSKHFISSVDEYLDGLVKPYTPDTEISEDEDIEDNILNYKGYYTTPKISFKENIIYGELEDIVDSIAFHGLTPAEFEEHFHEAVDNYLNTCKKLHKEPNKPKKS